MQSSTSPFKKFNKKQLQGEAKNQQPMELLLLSSLSAKQGGRTDGEIQAKSSDTSRDEEKSCDTPKFGEKPGDHSPPDNVSATGSQNKSTSPALQRRNSTTSTDAQRPKNTYTQVDNFLRLVDQMKQSGHATQILDGVVDFTQLMRQLL